MSKIRIHFLNFLYDIRIIIFCQQITCPVQCKKNSIQFNMRFSKVSVTTVIRYVFFLKFSDDLFFLQLGS